MSRIATSLAGALLAFMLCAPALAQTTTPPATTPSAQPSTMDTVKKRTKAEWAKLVAEWRKDKAKYTACNDKAKADKLKGTKRLSAVYTCMTQ